LAPFVECNEAEGSVEAAACRCAQEVERLLHLLEEGLRLLLSCMVLKPIWVTFHCYTPICSSNLNCACTFARAGLEAEQVECLTSF